LWNFVWAKFASYYKGVFQNMERAHILDRNNHGIRPQAKRGITTYFAIQRFLQGVHQMDRSGQCLSSQAFSPEALCFRFMRQNSSTTIEAYLLHLEVTTQIVMAREVHPAAWLQFIAGTDGIAAQVSRNLYEFWRV